MVVRIVKKPAPIDDLVEGAVSARPAFQEPTPEEAEAWWQAFPSPDVKPKPCKFCGDKLIRGCRESEHARCLNFYTAERRREREKSNA
jgi:hypothetical protein